MSAAAVAVKQVVESVAKALDLAGPVEVNETEGEIVATLHGEDLGLFIGRHGSTIDAVQHLAQRVAQKAGDSEARVVVDAEGYRERRRNALERQADRAAHDAVRSKRPVALDAMTASERKLVHEYLRENVEVDTYSEGDEPDRHLVVAPATTPAG
ncbi:MAG: KH domain-containing protein [Solirubrobacteraceae bacterium]|nr:KH domain-containing protein [Solirubrobacteraceae bacterium]